MIKFIKKQINQRIATINYSSAVSVAASICNHETFAPMKDCNIGKEVALCGAGPTFANYTPMDNVLHVALNRALLNEKIKFDYFIADDWDGIKFLKDELIKYSCKKFLGHQIGCDYMREIPESLVRDSGAKRYYTDSYYLGGYRSKYICDIDKMAIGNMPNIALSAMQIILFTRPKIIYLVGCDASDTGHFIMPTEEKEEDTRRFQAESRVTISGNKIINKWIELRHFAETFYPDVRIVSVNPVGLKTIFEDVYQKGKGEKQ